MFRLQELFQDCRKGLGTFLSVLSDMTTLCLLCVGVISSVIPMDFDVSQYDVDFFFPPQRIGIGSLDIANF